MIRVAFTSNDGNHVDEHFGKAQSIAIWQVAPDTAEEVATVAADAETDDVEDKILRRAAAVTGCAIVYTTVIGGPAAAKLVARRIHPMKAPAGTPIESLVARLQSVLRGRPPPWLRKAMDSTAWTRDS